MVFNDKSGLMSGLPYNTLKDANVQLVDTLFPESEGVAMYQRTEIMFYSNDIDIYISQDSYPNQQQRNKILNDIQKSYAGGGTNFIACFDHICETLVN